MKKLHLLGAVCGSLITTTTNAALVGRQPATLGGTDYQAYYDDILNITWSATVNHTGFDNWYNHSAWVASYSIDGISGWRLPDFDVNNDGTVVHCVNDPESVCRDNELAYMVRIYGYYPMNTGPFSGLDSSGVYVSSTEYSLDPSLVWGISLSINRTPGSIGTSGKSNSNFIAWAVYDGDIAAAAVPVPAAIWLFGTGLLGLIGISRLKITG